MTPLEILDAAVGQGLTNRIDAPRADWTCGKVVGRWPGSEQPCYRLGRWEFPGSGFTGRMCTQHGAWFIRPKLDKESQ